METLRSVDLREWIKVGEGGNGTVYENPSEPDVILKVNNPRINTFPIVEHDFRVFKDVEALGLQTPRMLEIVKVGDLYGTVQERIHGKKSFSRLCQENPSRTEELARVMADESKRFFSQPCPIDRFPSRKAQVLDTIDKTPYLPRKYRKRVRAFAMTVPDSTTCVHGDFQMGNIIEAGGKRYWIDLDRFAYGDPMFDMGHFYLVCTYFSRMKRAQEVFHMGEEQFHRFWNAFAAAYTGQEDHADFDRLAGKYAILDLIVRYHYQPSNFLETLFFRKIVCRVIEENY